MSRKAGKAAASKAAKKANTAAGKAAKQAKPSASTPQLFMFSYHEHDWDEDAFKRPGDERLRRARTGSWTSRRASRTARDNYCEVDSSDALAAQARAFIVRQCKAPAEAIELPLAALRRMLDEDGWSFVGGRLLEFEGNHNDTLIYALLAPR